jgi:hypothetical protein
VIRANTNFVAFIWRQSKWLCLVTEALDYRPGGLVILSHSAQSRVRHRKRISSGLSMVLLTMI